MKVTLRRFPVPELPPLKIVGMKLLKFRIGGAAHHEIECLEDGQMFDRKLNQLYRSEQHLLNYYKEKELPCYIK